MTPSEHQDQLLVVFLKALDRVSAMSGSLESIKSSLNEDIKPELRAIKSELKEKVNVIDYMEHKKEIDVLTGRVDEIEDAIKQKDVVKKSWKNFFNEFMKNWQSALLLIVIVHYFFVHIIFPNIPVSSIH